MFRRDMTFTIKKFRQMSRHDVTFRFLRRAAASVGAKHLSHAPRPHGGAVAHRQEVQAHGRWQFDKVECEDEDDDGYSSSQSARRDADSEDDQAKFEKEEHDREVGLQMQQEILDDCGEANWDTLMWE